MPADWKAVTVAVGIPIQITGLLLRTCENAVSRPYCPRSSIAFWETLLLAAIEVVNLFILSGFLIQLSLYLKSCCSRKITAKVHVGCPLSPIWFTHRQPPRQDLLFLMKRQPEEHSSRQVETPDRLSENSCARRCRLRCIADLVHRSPTSRAGSTISDERTAKKKF